MRNLPGNFSLALAGGMLKTWLTHLEIDESQVERERLPYSIAYGSMTFIRDTRNDTFNPEAATFSAWHWKGLIHYSAQNPISPNFLPNFNIFTLFLPMPIFIPLSGLV